MDDLYLLFFFFFNDTATTEIYTLSLHDALPISKNHPVTTGLVADPKPTLAAIADVLDRLRTPEQDAEARRRVEQRDRKSTRLNSSHSQISYAVFCLKKKKT